MRSLHVGLLLLSSGLAASAQTVISAHSGVLHLIEGSVSIDGKPLVQKYGTFPDWKEKSELRTEAGRAEVLLTPGVFLRVGENSAVRMIDNRLSATRIELLSGEAVVESDDPMKENAVTLVYGDYEIQVRKNSVFTVQAQPAQLRVYNGEAAVVYQGDLVTVKAGHLLPFSAALAMEKFDNKEGDELTRWSRRRSEYVSAANVSSAKSLKDSGSSWSSNGWYYNPFYSMYTYVPGGGMYTNPYGFGLYSPYSVYSYLPYGYGGGYYGGRGYYGGSSYGGNSYGGGRNTGHVGDQSGSFGRSASSVTAAPAASGNNAGFGRGASGIGASSGAAASSGGGGFSHGGGSIGGGGHGSK